MDRGRARLVSDAYSIVLLFFGKLAKSCLHFCSGSLRNTASFKHISVGFCLVAWRLKELRDGNRLI
jgi:hypothetical protein